MANIDSCTRLAFTVEQAAGVKPESVHSETPYGAFMDVELAASIKCSDMTLMTPNN